MKPVHGDGHALMGLGADGSEAHRSGVEVRHDALRGFNVLDGDGGAPRCVEADEVAQAHGAPRLVQMLAEREEGRVIVVAHRLLQQIDGLWVDEMVLAAGGAPLREAERGELVGTGSMRSEFRFVVSGVQLMFDILHRKPAHA